MDAGYDLIVQACPGCGEEGPTTARFCPRCGTRLTRPDGASETRKVVTVIFSDVVGSTSLGERLDPERLRGVYQAYFERMQSVLARHGGAVEKFVGDAIMAVFGVPRLHEDDALRAVRAAYQMRAALHELNDQLQEAYGVRLQVRTGVSTGEVLVGQLGSAANLALGDTVNVAARLEQCAGPDEIVVSGTTFRLVRHDFDTEPMPPLSLKGKSRSVEAYRIVGTSPRVRSPRQISSVLIGRNAELALLNECLDRSFGAQRCERVTLVGAPGVGKSRLVHEFIRRLPNQPTVIRGRCLAYGERINFWALNEALRDAISASDNDGQNDLKRRLSAFLGSGRRQEAIAARLASLLGISEEETSLAELSWAVRSFLEILAFRNPTVVIIDDLQWADTGLMQIIRDTAERVDAPLLLLCLSRPDLNPSPRSRQDERDRVVPLEPLTEPDTRLLVHNLLRDTAIPDPLSRRIIEVSEGNPLFVEQLLEMLIDDGSLRRADGRWQITTALDAVRIPPTIRALLAARVDMLEQADRGVIACASVIGRIFPRDAVIELAQPDVRDSVSPRLTSLAGRDLIRLDPQAIADEMYRFRHLLIRDAAYEAIPKSGRAALHTRLSRWLHATAGDRVIELEAVLGYHLEQAYLYRLELGPLNDQDIDIGRSAAEWLTRAAHRAASLGDVASAARYLRRSLRLTVDGSETAIRLRLELGDMLLQAGELAEAADVIRSAQRSVAQTGAALTEANARVLELLVLFTLEPQEAIKAFERESDGLLRTFGGAGDERGLARAWRLRCHADVLLGSYEAAAAAIHRAADHARAAGDRREERDNLCWLVIAAVWGALSADDMRRECEDAFSRAVGDRKLEAVALLGLAVAHVMQGRNDEAGECARRAGALVDELGASVFTKVAQGQMAGYVHMLAGDWRIAEDVQRQCFAFLEQQNDKAWLASLAPMLGLTMLEQGKIEDAEYYTRVAEQVSAADDFDAQARWRNTRAAILIRQNRNEEAAEVAEEACRVVAKTDILDLHADVLSLRGQAQGKLGLRREAARSVEQAVRLYERKGNLVSAARARAILIGLNERP